MIIVFADKGLSVIETEDAGKLRLPIAAVVAARRKLVVLRAAPDERTLRNWKSLHYEKLKGDKQGLNSIKLNDQWRMVLTIDTGTTPPTARILRIEDYH